MSVDVFTMTASALPGALLSAWKGREQLNRPYEVELYFTVPSGTDAKSAVGTPASLLLDRGKDGTPMAWHGVLAKIRLLHETAERALYRAVMVPKLWLLAHHVRSHVFTKAKLGKIFDDTLTDGGLSASDYAISIDAGVYPQEEFVCQYRESHLDFFHRWLERVGAYYYFEHAPDEDGVEKMLVVDAKEQHNPLFDEGRVRYFPHAGDTNAGECFRELHVDYDALPAEVLISDYNYANPAAPVEGTKPVSKVGKGKLREYGYRVFDEGEAKRLAAVKAQSMACREVVLHATGNARGLRAGYVFELEDGPGELPTKWLAIEVRHAGQVSASSLIERYTGLAGTETYRVDVVAIPADVQYRAPQTTTWPRIYGFENGTVDGPATSQYAQIDDHGRYLVRLKFDASDLPDGSTSTYLRMMQPHGGTQEGFHFPLRKGTEVMVAFQGGDPDRPVISGVVPNAQKPSVVTSTNHTLNVLRTGGLNHMVIEDLEGKQHIDLFTPVSNTNIHMGGPATHAFSQPPKEKGEAMTFASVETSFYMFTEGNAGFDVGGTWWQNVNGKHWVDLNDDSTTHVQGIHTLHVTGNSIENYDTERNTTVLAHRKDVLKAGCEQNISGGEGLKQTITPKGEQKVTGPYKHDVSTENFDKYGTWKTEVGGTWDAKVTGGWTLHDTPTVTFNLGTEMTINVDKLVVNAKEIDFTANAKCELKAPKHLEFEPHEESFAVNVFELSVFKEEIQGLVLGSAVMQSELCGMKVERVGFVNENKATEVEMHGSKLKQGALFILSAGLIKL